MTLYAYKRFLIIVFYKIPCLLPSQGLDRQLGAMPIVGTPLLFDGVVKTSGGMLIHALAVSSHTRIMCYFRVIVWCGVTETLKGVKIKVVC